MDRPAQFTVLCGQPGSGKTTKLGAFIKNRLQKGDRAIIIDPTGNNPAFFDYPLIQSVAQIPSNFKGGIVLEYEDETKDEPGTFTQLWERINNQELENFNLVLDDANLYTDVRPERALRKLITRARNHSLDLWSTAHSLNTIPIFFQTYVTMYGFLPLRNMSPQRSNMESYNELLEVMQRVNRIAKQTNNPYYIEYCTNFGEPIK